MWIFNGESRFMKLLVTYLFVLRTEILENNSWISTKKRIVFVLWVYFSRLKIQTYQFRCIGIVKFSKLLFLLIPIFFLGMQLLKSFTLIFCARKYYSKWNFFISCVPLESFRENLGTRMCPNRRLVFSQNLFLKKN